MSSLLFPVAMLSLAAIGALPRTEAHAAPSGHTSQHKSSGMQVHSAGIVDWMPAHIQVGSPMLLHVENARKVSAQWRHHPLKWFQGQTAFSWYSLAGVDVEATAGQTPLDLQITRPDGSVVKQTVAIMVEPSHYKQVTLNVEKKFVSPDAETLQRIGEDRELKDKAFTHTEHEPLWTAPGFQPPVKTAQPTDSFGTRRVFNGELASIHKGLDYKAASGTQVFASASGRVLLASPLFYEGDCVIVDHGDELYTVYMHLSSIVVKAGQMVGRGQMLGLSGATGRATGPHLHFAVRWQSVYLDPNLLLKMRLPQPRE